MTTRLPTFSVSAALAYAAKTLSEPPKWEHVERVAGVGELVARFVLPLELCQTSNARMRGGFKQRRAEAAMKQTCFAMMLSQNNGRREAAPLTGRPFVRAIRFSSKEPDHGSDWAKNPIDRLVVGKTGLGYLVDDAPKFCKVVTFAEYAPPSSGFCLVEIYTGEAK